MDTQIPHLSVGRAIFSRRIVVPGLMLVVLVVMLIAGMVVSHQAALIHAHTTTAGQSRVSLLSQSGTPRLEVFANVDGVIEHQWSDDNGATWSSWVSLPPLSGSFFVADPVAVSDGAGRLTVFTMGGANNTIYFTTSTNGSWLEWAILPGIIVSSGDVQVCPTSGCDPANRWNLLDELAVTSWGPGRMEVFDYGQNTATGDMILLHTWADNDVWSGAWETLGFTDTSFKGFPVAVSWGPGRDDVCEWLPDDTLLHLWFANGSWSNGENPGGTLIGWLAANSQGPGQINVYTLGTGGDLVVKFTWPDGSWSSGWESLGGQFPILANGGTYHFLAATAFGPRLDVFALNNNGQLIRQWWNTDTPATWSGWVSVGPAVSDNIAATYWVPVAPPPPSDTPVPPTDTPAPPTVTPTPTPLPTATAPPRPLPPPTATPRPTATPTRCLHPPCILPK